MKLYVIDLDYMCLEIEYKSFQNMVKNRFKARQLRETRKSSKWSEDFVPVHLFRDDPDMLSMRAMYTKQFFSRFDMAYRNYEAGQWLVAKDMLLSTQYMLRNGFGEPHEDGPSSALLAYMKDFGYAAPSSWPGYRELTEK